MSHIMHLWHTVFVTIAPELCVVSRTIALLLTAACVQAAPDLVWSQVGSRLAFDKKILFCVLVWVSGFHGLRAGRKSCFFPCHEQHNPWTAQVRVLLPTLGSMLSAAEQALSRGPDGIVVPTAPPRVPRSPSSRETSNLGGAGGTGSATLLQDAPRALLPAGGAASALLQDAIAVARVLLPLLSSHEHALRVVRDLGKVVDPVCRLFRALVGAAGRQQAADDADMQGALLKLLMGGSGMHALQAFSCGGDVR